MRTEVWPVVQRVLNGFSRVYPVEIESAGNNALVFNGDEADLLELLGNIVENACKFASSRVKVTLEQTAIIVEDDGPGISPEKYSLVIERGGRLESDIAGSGIGLAVASDIADLYFGRIELEQSAMSGLKVLIFLPLSLP